MSEIIEAETQKSQVRQQTILVRVLHSADMIYEFSYSTPSVKYRKVHTERLYCIIFTVHKRYTVWSELDRTQEEH